MPEHSIQPYDPLPLADSLPGEYQRQDGESSSSDVTWIVSALRRRWLLILLIWLIGAAAAVTAIQLTIRPTYTATALIEVAPVIRSILNGDDHVMPEYRTYLYTQAELIASRPMLLDALRDPDVQSLPLCESPDAVGLLRRCLSVDSPSYTQLLQLQVVQEDPDSAVRLAGAVLRAYMTRAGGLHEQAARQRQETLEMRRKELLSALEEQEQEIQKLAGEYGTSNETTFADLRKGIEQLSLETRRELEQVKREIIVTEQKIRQLDQSVLPEELQLAKDQLIDADAGVRWVRREIIQQQERITRLTASIPEGAKPLVEARQEMAKLQARFEKERARAASLADQEITRRHEAKLHVTQSQLQNTLASALRHRDMLQALADEQNAKGQTLGRTEAQIKAISERRDRTRQDYAQVVQALADLAMEQRQPARISIASSPEIREDGIRDRRKKMSAAALVGCLLLATGLGLLRDRFDPRVRSVDEVQAGTGLQVLGAVPSVTELRSGKVTQEHFLESYRVIRETLTGMTAAGQMPRSLLITSAQAGEGKTSLAVSLAISLAELGTRVLLIDGDVQAPQIGKLLRLNPPHSLRSVLLGQRRLTDAVVASSIAGLDVLVTRSNGDTARHTLNARTVKHLLAEAVDAYDHIVIDSPPALGAADALVWAHAADGVVLSSLVGMSDRHAVHLACRRLQSVGANLLGSVIANVSINETYYSYSTTSCAPEIGPESLGYPTGKRRCPPLVHLPDNSMVADEVPLSRDATASE